MVGYCKRRIGFQQDGASVHYGGKVRPWLNANFPYRWIGRNDEASKHPKDKALKFWPARLAV